MYRQIHVFLLLAVFILGVAAPGRGTASAADASGPETQQSEPPPTIASTVDRQISAIEKQVVEAAEAMPEDKFNFSPEGLHIPGSDYQGVRTFALQVKHVAASNYVLWAALTGDELPEDWKGGNGPEALKTKADILKFLNDSFALGHRAAATLTTENMLQTAGHSTSSRLHRATFAVEHAFDHYGQMVEYLRMNGIVPPASRGKSDASAPPAQQPPQPPAPRVVDLKASDDTILKASYFAAAKPGPGVLLLHQINRQRKAWDDLAGRLAAAGIHTLTLDLRGFGDSGGTPHDKLTPGERSQARERMWPGDIDTAWQYLVSQPGVQGDVIGVGGAGALGVDDAVQAARRHPEQVKSLVLLSGETSLPGMQFMQRASQMPGLYVVAEDDEYPPTVEAMEWLYISSSNPGRKFVHYPGEKPPWLGFEDVRGVPATGSHGTDMFRTHPDLPGTIVDWYVTTLIKTPGRAPAEPLACAPILHQIEAGEIDQVAQQLAEARRRDPQAQLFPEISVTLMGYDQMRVGNTKLGVETMKLNVTAYPESADANDSLSDAYLADGQKDLARRHAEKALALLASDTSDSEVRRKEIRDSAQQKLEQLGAAHSALALPGVTPAMGEQMAGVPNFAVVSPVLSRGGQPTREGFRALRERGIRTIVALRWGHDDDAALSGLGLNSYRLRAKQWHPETEDVVRAMKVVLTPEYQPVFVHCQAGKDRTGLVVAVYRILVDGWSVDDAIAERKAFGATDFWEENKTYLNRLRSAEARRDLMVAIEAAPMPPVVPAP